MKIIEVEHDLLPMSLLLEADPSETKVKGYLEQSKCFAVTVEDIIVASCAVIEYEPSMYELMNIAVESEHQSKGIGSQLLNFVIESIRLRGAKKLSVGTGTFGYQLAYYQKAGFRAVSIERDFFINNYPDPIFEQGIQHKDMLKLEIEFEPLAMSSISKATDEDQSPKFNTIISIENGEHYQWGENCDAWHLVKSRSLSVIQESIPPGCSELKHFHEHSEQFFYIISGTATMEIVDECYILTGGKGMYIKPGITHKLSNDHQEPLIFIVISTPPGHGDRVVVEKH